MLTRATPTKGTSVPPTHSALPKDARGSSGALGAGKVAGTLLDSRYPSEAVKETGGPCRAGKVREQKAGLCGATAFLQLPRGRQIEVLARVTPGHRAHLAAPSAHQRTGSLNTSHLGPAKNSTDDTRPLPRSFTRRTLTALLRHLPPGAGPRGTRWPGPAQSLRRAGGLLGTFCSTFTGNGSHT